MSITKQVTSLLKKTTAIRYLAVAGAVAALYFLFVRPCIEGFEDSAPPAEDAEVVTTEESVAADEMEESVAADEQSGPAEAVDAREAFSNQGAELTGYGADSGFGAPVAGGPEGALVAPNVAANPAACSTQEQIKPEELLPVDSESSQWAAQYPKGQGSLDGRNFLDAGFHIGMISNTNRNANQQIRSEVPNPQTKVSPWLQSTIQPDSLRRPLELGCDC